MPKRKNLLTSFVLMKEANKEKNSFEDLKSKEEMKESTLKETPIIPMSEDDLDPKKLKDRIKETIEKTIKKDKTGLTEAETTSSTDTSGKIPSTVATSDDPASETSPSENPEVATDKIDMPGQEDPYMRDEENPMGEYQDPNDPFANMEEEKLDPVDIGKLYIMKKIYTRMLISDEKIREFSETEFDGLKDWSREAIEHFQSVVANFDQFKDKLDEVIVLFQRFLVSITNSTEKTIKKVEKAKEVEQKQQDNEDKREKKDENG